MKKPLFLLSLLALIGLVSPPFDLKVEAKTSPKSKASATKTSRKPFINGHYVLSKTINVNGYHSYEPLVVIVDKGSHFTHVLQLQKDKISRVLTVSNGIGKDDWPTPPGRYIVASRTLDPKWTPTKRIDKEQKVVEPYSKDKTNPLGTAKITLNKFDIALHGTNAPRQLRGNFSHGCVRHSNADILKLYSMVKPGTVVYVVNQWRGKVLDQRDFGIKDNVKTASRKTKHRA